MAHLQVGFEIVDVQFELAPELTLCGLGFAECEERASVERVRCQELRIELHRALELGLGAAKVLLGEIGHPHEEVRFRRFACAEDHVHVLLALDDLVLVK